MLGDGEVTMIRSRDGALRLGPQDAGLELEHEEFAKAERAPGYRYELVAGRLHVTPAPNPPHLVALTWLFTRLHDCSRARPEHIGFVAPGGRLITTALGATTDVEPDISAYRTFPLRAKHWAGILPFLVVEVLSPDSEDKDLVRNREIYGLVPEIQEYWILDPYAEPAPTLLALARGPDGAWIERQVPPGGTYRTDLLPGLDLDLGAIFREP
jgi:Uma2 family endonuclease